MASGLALLLATALGAEAQVEAGIRFAAEARNSDPAVTAGEARTVDLGAAPHLLLRLIGGRTSLVAAYFPTFTERSVGPDARFDYLHAGVLRLRVAPSTAFELEAFGSGSTGKSDLLRETRGASGDAGNGGTSGAEGAATSSVLTTQRVRREGVQSGFSARIAPDRRTEILLSGSVSQDGGTDRESRVVYPVARTSDVAGSYRWSATRLDQVGVHAQAAQARLAALRTDSSWASAVAGWYHQVGLRSRTWLGAGVVALRSRVPAETGPGRTTSTAVRPAAETGLAWTTAPPGTGTEGAQPVRELRTSGELAATLGATVDRLTGVAAPQFDARLRVQIPFTARAAVVGAAAGGQRWPQAGITRTGRAELGISFRLSERVLLDLSGYGTWQRSTDPAVQKLTVYGGILSLGLDLPALTF